MKLALRLLVGLLLSSGGEAWAAGSLRCEDRVISLGMTSFEVRKVCGEPLHVESTTETRVVRRQDPRLGIVQRSITVPIERWTYSPGPNDLIRSLIFEN